EREFRKLDLDGAGRRPLPDDEIELKIFHRWIKHLLHRGAQPMDLIDEEYVALFQIGEKRRKITGFCNNRPRGRTEPDAELARHDLRQRGLAEPGRTHKQNVIERLAAFFRGLDEDAEIGARLLLPDELRQTLRA